jgi:hypothetical protein
MRLVHRPEPDLDLEAVQLRLDAATQRRERDHDAVSDLRIDVISLLAEIKRPMQTEVRRHYKITAEALGEWHAWSVLPAPRDEWAGTGASDGNSRCPMPDRPSLQHRDCS